MERRVSKARWEVDQANHKVLKECPTLVTGASAILTMGIPMPPSDSSLGTAIPLNPSSTVEDRACQGMGGMGGPGRGPEDMDIDLEDLLGGIGGGGNRGGFKFSNQAGQKPRKQAKVQDDTIEKEIFVSIEEIASGCEKKMKISRKVMRPDGTRTMEDKVLKIVVKPGWKAGTKVTFAKEGDQVPGKIPADIAFIIKDKPHPLFTRDGVNLKYTYKIPLRESLCGTVVQVPTLEGTKVGINCTGEVLKPTTTKRLQGYGLPLPKEPNKRGDLIVSFDVLFPDQLSQSSKDIIYDVLSQASRDSTPQ